MKRKRKPEENEEIPEKAPTCVRLEGTIYWFIVSADGDGDCQRGTIPSAILRDNGELALDCNSSAVGPPFIYSVTLRQRDGLIYQGEWTADKPTGRETEPCVCRLYRQEDRYAFFGTWTERGEKWQWCGELLPESKESDR